MNIFPDNEKLIISEISRILKCGDLFLLSILGKRFNSNISSFMPELGFNIDVVKAVGQDIGVSCIKIYHKTKGEIYEDRD